MAAQLSFGVEFELFVPAGPNTTGTKERMQVFATAFTEQCQLPAVGATYSGSDYSKWQFKPDNSVAPAFNLSAASNPTLFELVSPKMQYTAGGLDKIGQALKCVGASNFFGGARVNKSCGFHVHIGRQPFFSVDELKNIAWNFMAYQSAFMAVQPKSRKNNPYCKALPLHARASLMACTSQNDIKNLWNRYHILNLQRISSATSPTIEIRLAAGTHNSQKAREWVRLLCEFVQEAAKKRLCRLPDDLSSNELVRQLLKRLPNAPSELQTWVEKRADCFADEADDAAQVAKRRRVIASPGSSRHLYQMVRQNQKGDAIAMSLTVWETDVDTATPSSNWVCAHTYGMSYDGWMVEDGPNGTKHLSIRVRQNQQGVARKMYLTVFETEKDNRSPDSSWVRVHEAGNAYPGWMVEDGQNGTKHFYQMVRQNQQGEARKMYLTVWETQKDNRGPTSSWVCAHTLGNRYEGWRLQ